MRPSTRSPGATMRLLRRADARVVPWKNGLGMTTELAVWPEGASLASPDFLWRLSAAKVETAGPFSSFPGCERILAVTSGAGLVLDHGGAAPRAVVRRLQPHRFSGDWVTSAELLQGPIVDFNVIHRRERVSADIQARVLDATDGGGVTERLDSAHVFVHVLTGALTARATGEREEMAVAAGDSVWARGPRQGEDLALTPAGPRCELVVVRLAVRD